MTKTIQTLAVCAVLALALAVPAGAAPNIDMLVDQLASGDPVAQCDARTLLRQAHSAQAAPKLAALLAHESEQVWRAAFNALADLANMSGVAGREADRLAVTDALMGLMAPETSDHLKRQAMRLLPLAVPAGYDVSPVGAQLANPELRERARACLEEINTSEAAKALCDALPQADPAFQAAMLQALAMMEDEASVETAARYVGPGNPPEVRAAAALALSWTGDPQWLWALQAARHEATETTVFDASDAVLRLADSMARAGGKWSIAMEVYRDVLATGANDALRGAALSGLGRFGDDTAVADIVAAVKAEPDVFFGPAMEAIEQVQGRAANEALLAAYDQFPAEMQVLLLGVFGRKKDPTFLGPLNAQVQSADPRFREAAIAALVQTGLPEAMDGMVTYALAAEGPQRAQVVSAIANMADQFRAQGNVTGAGSAFLGLYRLAPDEATRQHALEGIQQYPTPEAFAFVMDDIGTENLTDLSVPMLAGMTRALKDAGRTEEADRAYAALKGRLNSADAVRTMMAIAPSMGDAGEVITQLGFVTRWALVGPFPWSVQDAFSVDHVGRPDVDLDATYAVDNARLSWQAVDVAPGYTVDLAGRYGNPTNSAAYGYAEVRVKEDCDAGLRMGSDDGIAAWVNGELVHENNIDRGADIDQDVAPIKLKAGVNRILVECTQGGGGWNFIVRLTTADGFPLEFKALKMTQRRREGV